MIPDNACKSPADDELHQSLKSMLRSGAIDGAEFLTLTAMVTALRDLEAHVETLRLHGFGDAVTLRTVELFVPEIGESLNAVMREIGYRLYKDVCKRVSKALMVAGAGRIKRFDRPVELYFYPRLGPKRRKFDCTNYVVVVKAIEDRLVDAGVLRGDTTEYVRGVHLLAAQLAPDGIEGIRVRIVEVDAAPIPLQAGLDLPQVDELELAEF